VTPLLRQVFALVREYYETHDPENPEAIFELARRLKGDRPLKGLGFGLAFAV
jgi:hypothetical protein